MKQNVWCKLFNLHKYEVIKECYITSRFNSSVTIGINIVSRCTNCGKIKNTIIYTCDERRD